MTSMLTSAAISFAVFVLALLPESIGGPGAGADWIIQIVTQGGLGAVLLWIWWKTFQQSNQEKHVIRKEIKQIHQESVEESRRVARENASRHRAQEEALMELIRQQHESNNALRGVLSRLESRLEHRQQEP